MEKRITIDRFLKSFPHLRGYGITTKMLNVLRVIRYDGIVIYIDEITREMYFSMNQGGVRTWEQFCLYRDNFRIIEEFTRLIL